MKEHLYEIQLDWTGNSGQGTSSYRDYQRSYTIGIEGKPPLSGSADPTFRGDSTKYNPEELLVMSLSSCHMLWYLHLCSVNKIVVEQYRDLAEGVMEENKDGSGQFSSVTLKPEVRISQGDEALANTLHEEANKLCFIARSVNFPVVHQPKLHSIS